MGKLRDRMEADLKLAGYSDWTRHHYLQHAKNFAAHFMRSPEEMGAEEVRVYMLHLVEVRKVCSQTYQQVRASLGFLYRQVLRRPLEVDWVPVQKAKRRMPVILAGSEVKDLFDTVRSPKYRLIMMVMYSAGLRISEACRLQMGDIDPKRKTILVRSGKGGNDRYALLSGHLLSELEGYGFSTQAPAGGCLFTGRDPMQSISPVSVRKVFAAALEGTAIRKKVSPHGLRHAFATHLIESGVDVAVVKELLGHRSLRSTEYYLHVSRRHLAQTTSPLDIIHQADAHILG